MLNCENMKTYTSITNKGLVATLANNKNEAKNKIKEAGYIVSIILISSCHIDYTSGIKLK